MVGRARKWLEELEGFNGADPFTNGEVRLLKLIRRRTGSKQLAIMDVGGHRGAYTDLVLQCLSPCAVWVVEPATSSFQVLQTRFADNNNVTVVNTALSSKEGNTVLYSDYEGSSWSSLHRRRLTDGSEFVPVSQTRTSTLDALTDRLELSHLDLLKIDTEGHEYEVLRGAKQLLQKQRIEAIQFEFGGTAIDARIFFRDLFDLLSPTHDLFRIARKRLVPLDHYSERLENFRYANYLAIRKGSTLLGHNHHIQAKQERFIVRIRDGGHA